VTKIPCAIIGSGNIGTDLMIKVLRMSKNLEMGAMVGIDPNSDGLKRAARLNVPVTHEGIEGLRRLPNYKDIRVVFDATLAFVTANRRLDPTPNQGLPLPVRLWSSG